MTTRIKRSLLEITATALMASVCLIPTIDGDAAAKKVKVSKNTVTVKEKAKATITVKNAGKKKVTAKLANKKIAKIKVKKNKITVTGKKAGKTNLTVSVKGLKKCKVKVNVKAIAKKTAKTTNTTNKNVTPSAPKGPDMQTVGMTEECVRYLQNSEYSKNITVTAKKIEDQIVFCATNNNNVAVQLNVWGEGYKRIELEENSNGIDSLVSANYIAPHGKYYGVISSYKQKSAYKYSVSDIKIGSIYCTKAESDGNSDFITTKYDKYPNGTWKATITPDWKKTSADSINNAIFVFKDAAGNVLQVLNAEVNLSSSSYSDKERNVYLYDAPASFNTVEAYYDVVYGYYDDDDDEDY